METPKEYYYTYYSYEEWGRGYIGSRKCNCLPEKDVRYFGSYSDKTFKPTQKIILKSDYATREEALADEIILHDYYDVANNPHFANRAKLLNTRFCISKEQAIKNGKKAYELGLGMFTLTPEERSNNSRKLGKKSYELGIGVHGRTKEKRIEDARNAGLVGGKRTRELGVGICGITKEERSKRGKIIGRKHYKNKTACFSITPEQRVEINKKTNFQRWMCLETGYVTTAGPLTRYQKARGIDPSKRVRIS